MNISGTERVLDGVRSPVDRVAARVIREGYKYVPDKNVQTADQRHPHDVRNHLSIGREHRWMVGHRFGRMVVLGLSFETRSKHATWSVRCDCGVYTLRTAKAIRNPNNSSDCCDVCRHLLYLKRKDIYRRTGIDVDERNI